MYISRCEDTAYLFYRSKEAANGFWGNRRLKYELDWDNSGKAGIKLS
jgi:hypothetical protein